LGALEYERPIGVVSVSPGPLMASDVLAERVAQPKVRKPEATEPVVT
jgi:hypothetical protein